MLARFADLLAEHDRARTALGAFTCYDLEDARGVLAAAAARDVGVVLLISRDAFAVGGGECCWRRSVAAAERSPARACVQLDHVCRPRADRQRALELGVGRRDGRRLAPAVRRERRAGRGGARLADATGAGVEAELGHVAGGEDVAVATEAGGLTDLDEAKRFVEATGVDLLAVSIGNVHGKYASEPRLDWDRARRDRGAVDVPLSLHGASGLPTPTCPRRRQRASARSTPTPSCARPT